jgi:hypothetical protein
MKTVPMLAATLVAFTSFSLLAQQTPPGTPSGTPPAAQPGAGPAAAPGSMPEQPPPAGSPSAQPEQPASPAANPETQTAAAAPVAEMRPVHAQLVSKLDTKTAKTGDDVVVETKGAVKTADGTEIPKGTKLVGHVIAVQPSTGGTNSQVALAFDHAQLASGQSLPIQSEIKSIAPAGGEESASSGAVSEPATVPGGTNPGGAASGSARGMPGAAPASAPGAGEAAAGSGQPAAGTVVAKNGNIDIRTTSIPNVLLANNQPGQQDPRMAKASSILLGAKQDVQLEGGTQMVLAVATMPGGGTQ